MHTLGESPPLNFEGRCDGLTTCGTQGPAGVQPADEEALEN